MKRNLLFIVFASVVLNAWSQNVSEGSIGFLEFHELNKNCFLTAKIRKNFVLFASFIKKS